jgi:hypothetical protein
MLIFGEWHLRTVWPSTCTTTTVDARTARSTSNRSVLGGLIHEYEPAA